MKRKAILIESSKVNGQSEIPGAKVDVQNWVNFLKSDLGGAWVDKEIVSLSHPFRADVAREMEVDSDSYCFVAFSGHGAEGSIVLNDYVSDFPIALLRPKSNRATIILDTCRGVDAAGYRGRLARAFANEATFSRSSVQLEAFSGSATIFASAHDAAPIYNRAGIIEKHRMALENALTKSPNGTLEMLACAKGQGADEDPKSGGYYTSLLLQSADMWHLTDSGPIHTTRSAHDYAATKLPAQQTPEYRPGWLAFPFAVKV